jgi:hypothetical protein
MQHCICHLKNKNTHHPINECYTSQREKKKIKKKHTSTTTQENHSNTKTRKTDISQQVRDPASGIDSLSMSMATRYKT